MELEKTYKELAKKHKLPDFAMLDREFEVSSIENDKFLLKEIIIKMTEKIDFYAMLINSVLHPDNGTLAPLHECKAFDDGKKDKLFDLYRRLMHGHRKGILSMLRGNEKEEATFITEFFKEWAAIKSQLEDMLNIMQSSWEGESSIKEELRYFG